MTNDQTFPQTRTLTLLAVVQVIGGIGNGAGLAVGVLLLKDVSGSEAIAGTATVMLTLGAALATMPLVRLAVRAGRRPALTVGWVLGGLGAALVVAGAELEQTVLVMAGLLMFGCSTAANLQSRFAATDRAAPNQIGRSLSIVMWSTTVGAVAGPNLIDVGAAVADRLSLPDLAGPMVFSTAGFLLAGLVTWVGLRPEPLILAESRAGQAAPGVRAALPFLKGPVLTAVVTVAGSHAVMVGVMSLTPVHMENHDAALKVIGLTISLHIAGMFALSPLFGWLSDRLGPRPVIIGGQIVLIASVAIAGTAGDSDVQITVGLVLLGIGWSASVIAAAALLTASLDPADRPTVQGFSDLVMSLAGASGGLLAGVLMAWSGFGLLSAVAGTITIPVIALVLIGRRVTRELAAG